MDEMLDLVDGDDAEMVTKDPDSNRVEHRKRQKLG